MAGEAGFLSRLYHDVHIRAGIKMAIAGMLAFAIAQYAQLDNPTWCLFTVVVLMVAQYVGAIGEKSVLRIVGTVAGGCIGVLLSSGFQSYPWVLLSGVFVTVAFCTTMFGGNYYPYMFYLCALTMLVVVTDSMSTPAMAWHVALIRIEEICLGVVISMFVAIALWPRYARDEYRVAVRSALADLGRLTMEKSKRLLDCGATESEDAEFVRIQRNFSARMNGVRLLMKFAQRESIYFKAKVPLRMRMIGEMGAIFEAAASLGQRLPDKSRYRDLVGTELRQIHELMEAEFQALSANVPEMAPENKPLADAVTNCYNRLTYLRDQGATLDIPIDEALDFSAHFTTISDIERRLAAMRQYLHVLLGVPDYTTSIYKYPAERFHVSAFWIRNGIKSAVTAVVALVFLNWSQAPGGTLFVFGAWLFTAQSKTYPGGQGDRRAFYYALMAALWGIPYVLLLLVITPYLANYLWMNVFIFTGLVALGWIATKLGGLSIHVLMFMLFFVSAVGLNPQVPVGFQTIMGSYFGVVIATFLSAVIQRMLWPLLPQNEISSLFEEFFRSCRQLMARGDAAALNDVQCRLMLIPSELGAWLRVANTPEYPAGESQRLSELLRSAERLAYCILSVRKLDDLETPPEVRKITDAKIADMEESCRDALKDFEAAFRDGQVLAVPVSQGRRFESLEPLLAEVRRMYLVGGLSFPDALLFLGSMNFLEESTKLIDRCTTQLQTLQLDRYSGDYAL